MCCDIQSCDSDFCRDRDQDMIIRGDDQAIERARSGSSCRRDAIRGEGASARIEAEQQPGTEGGCPDNAMGAASDFHQRNVRPWGREQTDTTGCGVEATDVTAARLGEPDHSLLINGHAVGKERLCALFTCQWIVLHEPGVGIEPPQGTRVQLRKPGVSVRIQHQVVGSAWQRERLACMTGIGHRDRGQGVELIASRRGEVVSDIVGVLFGKPDRIVWRDLYAHNARLCIWRRPLLERLRPWVKDGEVVPPHFAEPQASLVVNGEPHQAIVWLWQGILAKGTGCRGGCGSAGPRFRRWKRCSTRLRSLRLRWTLGIAAWEGDEGNGTTQKGKQHQPGIASPAAGREGRSPRGAGTGKPGWLVQS